MKTNGIIKIILLILVNLPIWIIGWPIEPDGLLFSPILTFIVISTAIPIYFLIKNKGKELSWPNWNQLLLNPSGGPLTNFDFYGLLFLTIGLSITIQSQLINEVFSKVGLSGISLGLGILTGIFATILINKRRLTNN